ncbi:MAG TPA: chemotaxis protein CheD, partial [Leptospiraceae bacterium]|nr:chemotaxis protein CheD [Leptospiraceae bacterium]
MDNIKGKVMHVGVAEWKTGKAPDALRTTLGSCVGIVLYSADKKIGGVAHILLGDAPVGKIVHRGKYARPALESLLADLAKLDIKPGMLTARIFGGGSMFEAVHSRVLQSIGPDNVRAATEAVKAHNIPVVAEDTGGTTGRTITLNLEDGSVLMRAGTREKYFYRVAV